MKPIFRRFFLSSVVYALVLFAPSTSADQRDPRLEPLFEALRTDGQRWASAEHEIWEIWLQSGNRQIDQLMARGIEHMARRRLGEAIAVFSEVIERAPEFAEAWNKRATAYFLDHRLEASVADIDRTLRLEPRHFGAIAGMGLILIRKDDPAGALKAFERVLSLHPNSVGAKQHVELLRSVLRHRSV